MGSDLGTFTFEQYLSIIIAVLFCFYLQRSCDWSEIILPVSFLPMSLHSQVQNLISIIFYTHDPTVFQATKIYILF